MEPAPAINNRLRWRASPRHSCRTRRGRWRPVRSVMALDKHFVGVSKALRRRRGWLLRCRAKLFSRSWLSRKRYSTIEAVAIASPLPPMRLTEGLVSSYLVTRISPSPRGPAEVGTLRERRPPPSSGDHGAQTVKSMLRAQHQEKLILAFRASFEQRQPLCPPVHRLQRKMIVGCCTPYFIVDAFQICSIVALADHDLAPSNSAAKCPRLNVMERHQADAPLLLRNRQRRAVPTGAAPEILLAGCFNQSHTVSIFLLKYLNASNVHAHRILDFVLIEVVTEPAREIRLGSSRKRNSPRRAPRPIERSAREAYAPASALAHACPMSRR